MNNLTNSIKSYWQELETRERLMLSWGSLVVTGILFYALVWQPWHKAITHMESVIEPLRTNLVWMRQQSAHLNNGGGVAKAEAKGINDSLLSIVEKTAQEYKVRSAIQQLVPALQGKQVSVVLEEANFNQWVRWVDVLLAQYAVTISQLSAERDDDKPNVAEIRVTFERN